MKRKRYTEEQIVYALKQAENGTAVAELYRTMGVSEATFYTWRKKYKGLGVNVVRELAVGVQSSFGEGKELSVNMVE